VAKQKGTRELRLRKKSVERGNEGERTKVKPGARGKRQTEAVPLVGQLEQFLYSDVA
jgi:hypothetical protein